MHWLRVPENLIPAVLLLDFEAVTEIRSGHPASILQVFRCLHGTAPWYLAGSLRRAADVDGRRHHRSANAVSLVVPSTRRTTLGDRAFPVAAARAWNDLPPTIRASPSRRRC